MLYMFDFCIDSLIFVLEIDLHRYLYLISIDEDSLSDNSSVLLYINVGRQIICQDKLCEQAHLNRRTMQIIVLIDVPSACPRLYANK